MKTTLKDIAEIRGGVTVRNPRKDAKTQTFPVIQIKNVKSDGFLNLSDLSYAELADVKADHLLQSRDVLFCARGTRNAACVFGEQLEGAVAGSQLFVVQAREEQVLPAYLAWFMNQRIAQEYLSQHLSGSYIRMVRRSVLLNMPVVVPPADVQKRILELWELGLKEQQLLDDLKKRRQDLVKIHCEEILKEYQ